MLTEPDAGWEQKAFRRGNIRGAGIETESYQQGFTFGNDGTKLYIVGYGADNIEQFNLSTAYSVSTMIGSEGRYDLAHCGITGVYAIRWKPDGTKFYIVDVDGDDIIEFSVSNAWDITSGTITEGTNYYVGGEETWPTDVALTDGTKMFVLGNSGNGIDEYSLSTGYDLSSTVAHVRRYFKYC